MLKKFKELLFIFFLSLLLLKCVFCQVYYNIVRIKGNIIKLLFILFKIIFNSDQFYIVFIINQDPR